MATQDPHESLKDPRDLIQRGSRRSTPGGTAVFIGLRSLDVVFQYELLRHLGARVLSSVGVSTLPLSSSLAVHTGIAALDALGLPLDRLIILGMAVGAAAKQIFWQTYVSKEEFPAPSAAAIAAYNTVINSVNTLLAVAASTSASLALRPFAVPVPGTSVRLPLPIALGAVSYVVGIAIEAVSEVQRKHFKDDPANKGKIYTGGLWTWARHINYTGYTLWRTGYSLASGGWLAGLGMALFQGYDFVSRSTVVLDGYMTKKYPEQWSRYKQEVKWAVFPGLY